MKKTFRPPRAPRHDTELRAMESGQPVVSHGEYALEDLTIRCDGTIAGQVWGAGAALGRYLMHIGLSERPEVVEIGSGCVHKRETRHARPSPPTSPY